MELIARIKQKLGNKQTAELLKGSTLAMIFKVAGMALNFLFSWLIARYLGAGAVGTFSIFYTVILVGAVISKAGLDTASLKLIAGYNSKSLNENIKAVFKKALYFSAPLSLFLGIILFLSSGFLAKNLFQKPYLEDSFRMAGLCILPTALIFIISECLRGLKKIAAYSFLQRGSGYFFGTLVFIFLLFFSFPNPYLAYAIGLFLAMLFSFFLWKRAVGKGNPQELIFEETNYGPLLTLAFPMLITSSLGFIRGWVDTILLGVMSTDPEVGIYNVALKLSMLASLPLIAVNSISAPKFSEFHSKNDMNMVGVMARQSTKLIFWASFPVLLVFIFFPEFILGIYGEEFKPGSNALIILTIGQFLSAVSGSVGILMNMTGDEKTFRNITTISTIVCIVLNVLLIPSFGINGAAIANASTLILSNLLCIWYIHKKHRIFVAYIPFIKT